MSVTGTYRLQLHDGFGFADAERVVPYLARLGVSHLYLSPILQAAAGSMHGYDVVDHTRIGEGLGGLDGFERLAATAHEHGLGIVVDVVPNHMAFVAPETANRPLWELLRDGRDAATADWFDVDWKAGGGRLGLPVLGGPLEEILDAGELEIDEIDDDPGTGGRSLVIRYHDHVYPVALGTEGEAKPGDRDAATVRAVLDRQHYRLTSWRDKDDVLNYRRFFEVDELIAVRVELPEVFAATHALLLDLNSRGLIDGFRIDHPDGLADPSAYLEQLRKASTRGTLIWVEKILEGSEVLPTSWQCDGTTGYDAMRAIQGALVDTAAEPVLTRVWQEAGGEHDIDEAVEAAKRQVVEQSLRPEVERLVRRAREAAPDLDVERLRAAVVELLVAGEVYRAYVRPDEGRLSTDARRRLSEAFSRALSARPELEPELRALAPLTVAVDDNPAALDFAVRLQQTWGPVMAKGIEDTTFYRWHRLIALNEVGGDPADLEHGSPALLHRWAAHQHEFWPLGMTTLSTHDTKRSEDVRARLLAVAGDVEAWQACAAAASKEAAEHDVDAATAQLVWQTMVGVGPISADRLDGYLLKAMREAKQHTAWVDGDEAYEQRVLDFAHEVNRGGALREAVEAALTRNAEAIRATVLAAKALELTIPGVPDTYQGCEVVDLSLVDPDNRRPIDYERRVALLDALEHGTTPPEGAIADDLDLEKLHLTSRVLTLRRLEPDLFERGDYTPLESGSEHLLGFVRELANNRFADLLGLGGPPKAVATLVTRAPARLAASGGWGGATFTLPDGQWIDILSGRRHEGGELRCVDVFERHPAAVLVRR